MKTDTQKRTTMLKLATAAAALLIYAAPVRAQDAGVEIRTPTAADMTSEAPGLPDTVRKLATDFRAAEQRLGEIGTDLVACRDSAARMANAERDRVACHVAEAGASIEFWQGFGRGLESAAGDLRAIAENWHGEEAAIRRRTDEVRSSLRQFDQADGLLRDTYARLDIGENATLSHAEEAALNALAREVILAQIGREAAETELADLQGQSGWLRANREHVEGWAHGLQETARDLVVPIESAKLYIATIERRGAWGAQTAGHAGTGVDFGAIAGILGSIRTRAADMSRDRPAGTPLSGTPDVIPFPEGSADSRAFLKEWFATTGHRGGKQ